MPLGTPGVSIEAAVVCLRYRRYGHQCPRAGGGMKKISAADMAHSFLPLCRGLDFDRGTLFANREETDQLVSLFHG